MFILFCIKKREREFYDYSSSMDNGKYSRGNKQAIRTIGLA